MNSVPLQEQCMFLVEPFLNPSIYLFVCGGVVEVRGQFLGVGSLLPLCRFLGGELGSLGLASRTFTPEPSFWPRYHHYEGQRGGTSPCPWNSRV